MKNENGTKLKFVPKKKNTSCHFDLRPAVHNSQYKIKLKKTKPTKA